MTRWAARRQTENKKRKKWMKGEIDKCVSICACVYLQICTYTYKYIKEKEREMEEDDHLLTCYCFKCLLQVYTLHQYLAELQLK